MDVMSSIITLPGEVTTSPLGKFHEFEGTWDSTVFLWDAEYQPLATLPANGSVLNNIMRARASAVSGLALSSCDFEVRNTVGAAATVASGELTARGGIHVANPQSGSQSGLSGFGLSPTAAFANWLHGQTDAGADYAIMVTQYLRCTRANLLAGIEKQSMAHLTANTSPNTNFHLIMSPAYPASNMAGSVVGTNQPPTNVAGEAGLAAVSSQGWIGTRPANLNTQNQRVWLNMGIDGTWATGNANKCGSYICYRVQVDIVDLSDVRGADRVAKCAAMIADLNAMAARDLGDDGRFGSDTFTAPATLKP
jgi:hypothetical protein